MFWEWLQKFIMYYSDNGNMTSFDDGLGEGSFGWRHILWILIVIFVAIAGYRYFKKHKETEPKVVLVLLLLLFFVRLTNQTVRAIIGVEKPWTMAFPFHMCTVLTFLLPITYVFKLDKIKTAVYVLSIMGGTITLLMGDYFSNWFLTFFALEGMWAHSLLIWVPIFEIASGRFKLDIKLSWQVIVGILVLMAWASLANYVFFTGYDPNYMYLLHNALPFGNEENFFFLYILIFLLFFTMIYGSGYFYRKLKK